MAQQPHSLEQFHAILRKYPDPHDTYLSVARVGNEETIPLLLQRFRLDYGISEPAPHQGVGLGFICTRVHLVDALKTISNTDQGMYYPRWAAWWDANKALSQRQWILNGFAAQGLHIAEPMDERFAFDLIEVMGQGFDYPSINARRLLASERHELRSEWLEHAATSEQRFHRLGAVRVISQIDTTSHEDLLRRLAGDSDLDIRREALTTLNVHLRASFSETTSRVQVLCRQKDGVIESISFAGNTVVAASSAGTVKAVDPGSLRVLWTRKVALGLGYHSLVMGNEVVLASQEGALLAIDTDGHVLWHRETVEDEKNRIYRLIQHGDDIVVGRSGSIDLLDSRTGEVKSSASASDPIRDADSTQSFAYFVDAAGLHALKEGAGPDPQGTNPLGISVSERSVCVKTPDKSAGRVTCYEPGTLTLQWTQTISETTTWGHRVAPVQDGSRIFVPTNKDLTAFNASDGSRLWTTQGGQEVFNSIMPTDYGLLLQNSDYRLELRDPATGEVRRVWPQVSGVASIAIREQRAAIGGLNGELWVIDLSDSGTVPRNQVPH